MGSMGGKSEGRKKGSKYSGYQRPAEARGKAKVGKVPKGVQGHSLGGGAARANKGNSGCRKTAAVLLLIVAGSLGGLGWGAYEVVQAVVS